MILAIHSRRGRLDGLVARVRLSSFSMNNFRPQLVNLKLRSARSFSKSFCYISFRSRPFSFTAKRQTRRACEYFAADNFALTIYPFGVFYGLWTFYFFPLKVLSAKRGCAGRSGVLERWIVIIFRAPWNLRGACKCIFINPRRSRRHCVRFRAVQLKRFIFIQR